MEFRPLAIAGAFLIRQQRHTDARGFFARTFCTDEFAEHDIPAAFVQQSMARSERAGTLRGMHLQLEPEAEDKYIRCVRGRIFDAFVDLRIGSPTFFELVTVELDADDGDAVFVPRGLAHGYQTLVDRTDVLYAMTERYSPQLSRAFRYDEPRLDIRWPLADPILSDADRASARIDPLLDELTARSRSAATARNAPANRS